MKKLTALLAVFALTVALGACKKDASGDKASAEPTVTAEVTATASPTATPTPEPTEEPTQAPTQAPGEDVEFSNDDFSINIPAGWEYESMDMEDSMPFLMIVQPESFSSIDIIWTSDPSFKLTEFNEEAIQDLFDVIAEGFGMDINIEGYEVSEFGNKEGAKLNYSIEVEELEMEIKIIQILVPADDGTYILTATVADPADTEAMLAMVETLTFK